jgi:hypothetical protein
MGVKLSVMKRKLFLLAALALPCALVFGGLFLSRKVACLTVDTHARIEVDGALVHGELLEGKAAVIVTLRDRGNKHSYGLFFDGDTDYTGDMGAVVDCNEWVAPRFPVLLATTNYPPCQLVFGESGHHRWPLINKGTSMQFIREDRTTITITR